MTFAYLFDVVYMMLGIILFLLFLIIIVKERFD